MGRVCPAPCETGCNRNQVDDFVGINSVEHFVGDYAIANKLKVPCGWRQHRQESCHHRRWPSRSCPRLTSCAERPRLTIFDDHAMLGGMMRYGIPGFRTPRDVLDAEIQRIVDMGVEVKLKTRMGKDVTLEQTRKGVRRNFPRHGRPVRPHAAGSRLRCSNCRHRHGLPAAFNDGRLQHVGKRVVVIGGGDTSIDVATVARRLGHITVPTTERPEHIIAGQMATMWQPYPPSEGAEVVLASAPPSTR